MGPMRFEDNWMCEKLKSQDGRCSPFFFKYKQQEEQTTTKIREYNK